jgi:hypothetical protein
MSNKFVERYIDSLPYKEWIAVSSLLNQVMLGSGHSLSDLKQLPSISTVKLIKPKVDDILTANVIEGNHRSVVSYLNESYSYAQEMAECQKACDDTFNTTMSNIEKSLDQLRMELEAWSGQLSNKTDFSDTVNISFNPSLTMDGSGEEQLKITNTFVRSNTRLNVKELGPQYRFSVYSPTRINTDIFGLSTSGLQVELTLYVEPYQANILKLVPWISNGSPAYLNRAVIYGSAGEPVVVATGLTLNREYRLTFPKCTLQRVVLELTQDTYTISSLPTSTPGLTDIELLGKLKESIGNAYVNSLYKERFIDWQEVEKYISNKLRLDGMTNALLARRTGTIQEQNSNPSYHLYTLGLNEVSLYNQYANGEWRRHTFTVHLKNAPAQVTLRASDWIPDFTSVEYAVKTTASNTYIPIPNADETGYMNEVLYPAHDGICSLRFPYTLANSRMPILYEGNRQLENDEYELINDRQVRLTGTLSNSSLFSIRYEVKNKENIDIPYSTTVSVFHSIDGKLGETFEFTASDNSISLSETPYIDKTRLNQDSYTPIVVNIVGRSAEDITNWCGTKEEEFARIPDKDSIQYKVRGKQIYFDQPITQPFTVIYEYLSSDLDVMVSMRSYSIPPNSPSISSIQLSYLERS